MKVTSVCADHATLLIPAQHANIEEKLDKVLENTNWKVVSIYRDEKDPMVFVVVQQEMGSVEFSVIKEKLSTLLLEDLK